MRDIVVVELPRAGLANRLFCLLEGYEFAKSHNATLIWSGIFKISLGPFLRREKSSRLYSIYFKRLWITDFSIFIFGRGLRLLSRLELVSVKFISFVPDYEYLDRRLNVPYLFEAESIDFLGSLIKNSVKKEISTVKSVFISLHIRHGDFKLIGKDSSSTYFRSLLLSFLSTLISSNKPTIRIFTDDPSCLEDFSDLDFIDGSAYCDISSLFALGRSDYLILSPWSSFGILSYILNGRRSKILNRLELFSK